MVIAAFQVIIAICNYTFDETPAIEMKSSAREMDAKVTVDEKDTVETVPLLKSSSKV